MNKFGVRESKIVSVLQIKTSLHNHGQIKLEDENQKGKVFKRSSRVPSHQMEFTPEDDKQTRFANCTKLTIFGK